MSFLDSITPEGVKKINDGVQAMLDPINPFITDLTETNKQIASHLLETGITVQQIQDFVDISRTQLDPYLELEAKVMQRMAELSSKPVKVTPSKAK